MIEQYITPVGWILTTLAIVGSILNIYKSKLCFLIWGFCNVGFALINLHEQIYFQVALFSLYILLEIWGVLIWIKDEKKNAWKTTKF